MLHQTAQLSPNDDYFGEDSLLILTAQHTRKDYSIRPQDREGDLVIGRRTPRSPLNPDLDLSDSDGNRLGVSRLHLSIRYDPQYNTLTIFDLGSANGSFVNGQRLHPHEVRVLRHNDELRLGHMLLQVTFQHNPQY
jgi:pSer/pThr/pTyr-binding forkhead associated (FHA) protein